MMGGIRRGVGMGLGICGCKGLRKWSWEGLMGSDGLG